MNNQNVNAQKMICEAYGYTKMLPLDYEFQNSKGQFKRVFELPKKHMKHIKETHDNKSTPCAMCGNIHSEGYVSLRDAESLLLATTKDTFNECYSLEHNNFICEYCMYSTVTYGSPSVMLMGKKMVNSLVIDGKQIEKNFNSSKDNELYEILKNPPKPPFVILINSRGKVLENLIYTAKPTVSKGYVVVNYGLENLQVSPSDVFKAIETARRIAKDADIEITSDHIWNRQNDVTISLNKKLQENKNFIEDMGSFISKYNRDCRVVAKMILLAYLNSNKTMKELPKKVKEKKVESLLTF